MMRLIRSLKRVVFLGLMLVCFLVNGQESHKLSGWITDCKFKTAIAKARVKLVSSSGLNVETLSDSLGFYHFNDSLLKPDVTYVLSTIAPDEEKRIPFGMCPYSYFHDGYLNSSDKLKFKTDENRAPNILAFNFCLVPIQVQIRIPSVYFKKNSLDFDKEKIEGLEHYFYSGDTVVDCLVDLMKNYPDFVFELSGHADKKEKNAKELSELRVKKVYNLVVQKGVQKDRVYTKSYGSKRLTEDKNMAGQVIGELHGAINQRVVVSILRKDYNLPPKKDPPVINTEEED